MSKGMALYIHIPFCKRKCLYCDFTSYCNNEGNMTDYAKALSKEIDTIKNNEFSTIFIGGGTPTYLSLDGWNILKEKIKELKTTSDLEFTVEGNPGTFDEKKLKLLKDIGVNRLSIGLQSWQNHHLERLGRIHSVEEFKESFYMARKYGFENINVDLMFGLPSQTLEEWKSTLENVIEMNPEHLSCYSLIVEEGTKFWQLYEDDKLDLPNEDLEREMYKYTINYLKEKGYNQYEISNFAKNNMECRHNLVYWSLDNYIGCGVASHSYVNGYRYNNICDINKYISNINNNIPVLEEKNKNTIKNDMEEFMFMGLRKTKGVSIEDFRNKFGVSIYNVYENIINKYISQGLLIESNNYIFLSSRGIEVSNTIMSEFLM